MSNIQTDTQETEKISPPPPALLSSADGHYRFSLAILGWESTVMPCTRYDEWIICELTLHTPELETTLKGPYLLRFEVFDLKTAVEECLQNQEEFTFQSDFIETAFKINLQSLNSNTAVSISFKDPESKPAHIQTQFQVASEQLSVFIQGLELQLKDFYSVL